MFAVFAGYNYYPSGGWNDFKGVYETFEQAFNVAETIEGDWAHVVNLITFEKIEV